MLGKFATPGCRNVCSSGSLLWLPNRSYKHLVGCQNNETFVGPGPKDSTGFTVYLNRVIGYRSP